MSIVIVSLFLSIIYVLMTVFRASFTYALKQKICYVFVRKTNVLFVGMFLLGVTPVVCAQNFTSSANGVWTTGSNWSGGTAPSTSSQNYGTTNVNHDLTVNGGYSIQATLNIAASKTLQVNGIFSISNGAVVNVYGTLNITGSTSLNAQMFIFPGGKLVVGGNLTIINSTNLTVGTSVAPGAYADLVVKNNLVSQNSGDLVIERNGRVVIYKNFTNDTSGGTLLTIRSGGQIYINGSIALVGGGDIIANGNGSNPVGFYVNGTTAATGGGATITSNRGTLSDLLTNDKAFYDWVATQPGSPLPITLGYFRIENKEDDQSVALYWATFSEENFNRFSIERSTDGLTFESISEIHGAGNSKTTINYSYTDQNPVIGKAYYRLKAIDNDGSFEYSKILFTEFHGSKKMIVYPNPSAGEFLNYSINFNPQENDSIVVINSLGDEVASINSIDSNGIIRFNKALAIGTYILKYTSTHFQNIEKFIVK